MVLGITFIAVDIYAGYVNISLYIGALIYIIVSMFPNDITLHQYLTTWDSTIAFYIILTFTRWKSPMDFPGPKLKNG